MEWRPPRFGLGFADYAGRFWSAAILAALALPFVARRDAYLVALCCVTFLMAVNARRFIPLFALTAAPLVAGLVATGQRFVARWSRPEVDQVNVKHLDTWGDQVDAITQHQTGPAASPVARRPCPNLWYHGYIFWDGTLTSCERDFDRKTPLGNVRDGVLRAWHGEAMRKLRRMHRDGNFAAPACARCTEWSWWRPTPWTSKGTAPKVESHATEGP